MAYKFQLGAAKLSGSIEQTNGADIKAQTSFSIGSATVNEAQLEILDGATVTTDELNYLDHDDLEAADFVKLAAVTATAAEINYLDHDDLEAADFVKLAAVTATAAEINDLAGNAVAAADFTKLSEVTAGSGQINLLDSYEEAAANVASHNMVFHDGTKFKQESLADYATAIAGDALAAASGVLAVQVDDSSIETDSDALRVKALGVTNAMLAGSIANAKLANSTISGKALGANLDALAVDDSSIEYSAGSAFNGSAASTIRVKAAGITNAMLSGSITAEKLATGAGLTDNAGALEAAVDDSSIEKAGGTLNVKALGVTNAMLAGSIENAKLSNSTVSFGGVSLALGASDASPAFNLGDATAYPGDSSLVTVGAVDAGSITSGFGAINVGASAITTTGTGSFGKMVISGDLSVAGALTYIDTANLRVSDAKVVFADGASALAAGQGFYIGSDAGDASEKASFAVDLDIDGAGLDGFASSLPIKASAFYGDGSNLTGLTSDAIKMTVVTKADTETFEIDKINIFADLTADASVALPANSDDNVGKSMYIKAKAFSNGAAIIITASGATIDGESAILLESPYAAIRLVYVASGDWRVF